MASVKKNSRVRFLAVGVLGLAALLAAPVIPSEVSTIVGTVNDDFQIVTEDGQIYEVAENKLGDEVVNLVRKKVRVKGRVETEKGEKVITIIAYELIGK
jgi:hypothetical protein